MVDDNRANREADYQFNVCDSNNASPIGRTKTIPSAKDKVTSAIKLAIYSCSNFRKLPSDMSSGS